MTITKGSTSFLLELTSLSSVPPALGRTLTVATALGLGDEGLRLIGTRHGLDGLMASLGSPFGDSESIWGLIYRWKDSLWKLHPRYIEIGCRLWLDDGHLGNWLHHFCPTFQKFLSISNHNIEAAYGLKACQTCAALSLNGIGIHRDWVSYVMRKEVMMYRLNPTCGYLCNICITGLAHSKESANQKRERGVNIKFHKNHVMICVWVLWI